MIDERFIEALKYDERIWRAFKLLKPIHRNGLLDALRDAAMLSLTAAQQRIAELEAERDAHAATIQRLRALVEEACEVAWRYASISHALAAGIETTRIRAEAAK